jgi:hypothetical protein
MLPLSLPLWQFCSFEFTDLLNLLIKMFKLSKKYQSRDIVPLIIVSAATSEISMVFSQKF